MVFGWWVCHFFSPPHPASWVSILGAVAFADFSFYFIHRYFNHGKKNLPIVRWFRRNHAPHHSVEALDFLRGNLSSWIDTSVASFQIPLVIFGAILGFDLISEWVAYVLILLFQSTHHVNHTFNIGWLSRIFVDNHNHKIHHCPRGYLVNHGAVFSLWDQCFGTYYENRNISPSYFEKNRIPLPITGRSPIHRIASRSGRSVSLTDP